MIFTVHWDWTGATHVHIFSPDLGSDTETIPTYILTTPDHTQHRQNYCDMITSYAYCVYRLCAWADLNIS